MADERDPEISRRYRELGGEEPAPQIDASILAASRRAVAPRRRWYVPLATAAILVLAFAVTIHVEREQQNPEAITKVPQETGALEAAPRGSAPGGAKPSKREPARPFHDSSDAAKPAAPGFTPEPKSRAEQAARQPAREAPPAGAASSEAKEPAAAGLIDQSPERWLERIAELRQQGRHEQADKALADFKRRYPDYRIPEATLKRIQK